MKTVSSEMTTEGFQKAQDFKRCSEAALLVRVTEGFRNTNILGDAVISLIDNKIYTKQKAKEMQ